MKRFLPVLSLFVFFSITLSISALAQDIMLPIAQVVGGSNELGVEDMLARSASPKKAIDTIDTRDKFTRIILFEDHTWEHLDLGRPQIDEESFYVDWDTNSIHAFKEVTLESLPDSVVLPLIDSTGRFCIPIIGRVNSKFSFRGSREHKGIDIDLERGDTIRVAFDGVVRVAATPRQTGGYGNLLVVRHTNGLETYYGHLSRFEVEEGELVKAGEVIGYGGNTGRSTGPHLHFETRYMGKPFDPARICDFKTGALRDSVFTLHKHYFNIYSHYGQTDAESKAASDRIVHTIKNGDTLGKLAMKYHTTVKKICALNNISANTTLRIGRRLIVR